MESAEHLPETLEALEALVKPLWATAVPLHEKLKAADPKDAPKADSSTNGQQDPNAERVVAEKSNKSFAL